MDCESCALTARVERLEQDMAAEREARSRTHAEFYDRLRRLEQAQAVTATKLDTIVEKLDGISADLEDIKGRPSRRWEAVVAALITGVVAVLLAQAGLGG